MNNKLVIMFISTALLASCAHRTFRKPPINNPSDDATIKLAEAAVAVSDSMLEMTKVEKVICPPKSDNMITIPSSYNLQTRASIDWSGPIEELAQRIATAAHYRFRTVGQIPSLPILISLNAKDESLVELLRDIDYQAGKKAFIHVYPNSQVVELRYAKLYA